jgi:hypothetical protein
MAGCGGGGRLLLPGIGGSRLTGLAVVGEDAMGVGRLRGAGEDGKPIVGCTVNRDEQMAELQYRSSFQVITNK